MERAGGASRQPQMGKGDSAPSSPSPRATCRETKANSGNSPTVDTLQTDFFAISLWLTFRFAHHRDATSRSLQTDFVFLLAMAPSCFARPALKIASRGSVAGSRHHLPLCDSPLSSPLLVTLTYWWLSWWMWMATLELSTDQFVSLIQSERKINMRRIDCAATITLGWQVWYLL